MDGLKFRNERADSLDRVQIIPSGCSLLTRHHFCLLLTPVKARTRGSPSSSGTRQARSTPCARISVLDESTATCIALCARRSQKNIIKINAIHPLPRPFIIITDSLIHECHDSLPPITLRTIPPQAAHLWTSVGTFPSHNRPHRLT